MLRRPLPLSPDIAPDISSLPYLILSYTPFKVTFQIHFQFWNQRLQRLPGYLTDNTRSQVLKLLSGSKVWLKQHCMCDCCLAHLWDAWCYSNVSSKNLYYDSLHDELVAKRKLCFPPIQRNTDCGYAGPTEYGLPVRRSDFWTRCKHYLWQMQKEDIKGAHWVEVVHFVASMKEATAWRYF